MDNNTSIDLDLRGFVELNIKWIYCFGYFCPDFKEKNKRICYYIYGTICVSFMFVCCLLTQLADMVMVFGDIEKMSESSFLTLTNVAQVFKLYPFIVHSPRVRNLMNSVNREEFKPRNKEQYEILKNDISISRRNSKIFIYMCIATCGLWGLFPLFDTGVDEKIRLPLGGRFPFETDSSPIFEIVYVYQTVTAFVNGLGDVCMDTFLMGIIMVIAGELKVLNKHFQILNQRTDEAQTDIKSELIRNVEHYKSIIRFANEMTFLFTTCILVQFAITVMISCVTLFQLSLVPITSFQFASMLFYEGCLLLEIFLWCYYGNEVILQSQRLTESAYMCQWIDCPKDFKNDLLFFMTRSQIPLKLYAGGYFTLSLQTYMAIVKSSWSYFAVLNQVHSEHV